MSGKVALERQAVYVRHVRRRQQGETGGAEVLGDWYVPQPLDGVNGEQGWQSGTYEPHEGEEGSWAINLPNGVGGDGELHLRRFLKFTDDEFREGDEFIEIYEGDAPSGRLLWVGMVTGGGKRRGVVDLRGACAYAQLGLARETRAGFWTGHAPRDVFEHYTQVWQSVIAEDFATEGFVYLDSATVSETDDEAWRYRRAESVAGEAVQLRASTGEGAFLGGKVPFSTAAGRWRVELTYERTAMAAPPADLLLFSLSRYLSTYAVQFHVDEAKIRAVTLDSAAAEIASEQIALDTAPGVLTNLVIEGDRRWVYFYLDGVLRSVLPIFDDPTPASLVPDVELTVTGIAEVAVKVHHVLARAHAPYLLRGVDKGDYHLPGSPPVGGLLASYYQDGDLRSKHAAGTYRHVLNPTRQPYTRRQDVMVNYAAATPNQSVRWTGSVYLDLEASDIRLRVTAEDRARVWVGKTRMGEQLIDDWTSAGHGTPASTTSVWLRTIFGTVSGWYPIVVEASNDSGSIRALLEAEKSTSPGLWLICGNTGVDLDGLPLSPLGCYAQQVQGDTHYEMLVALRDTFGYQFTCEPRSLESGDFPGQLVPRVRLGRDTSKVLGDLGALEPVSELNAEASVDELIVDGAGLSDPGQATQQTYVATNFRALRAGRGMIHSEQESLSDITDLGLIQQRAESLLALRAASAEDVQVQPEDKSRDLIDRFPLTGELAEFDWGVGDGIRLAFEDIDVVDELPRQIKVVAWPVRPDGRGAPAVGFRQRPRNLPQVLRGLARLAQLPQRNYQGQLATASGNPGAHPAPTAAGSIADNWSRVNLPYDLARVVRAELVVHTKSDGSAMNIEINGTVRGTFIAVGRYDITPYVAQAAAGEPRMHARATGGTGTATYALELLVAV